MISVTVSRLKQGETHGLEVFAENADVRVGVAGDHLLVGHLPSRFTAPDLFQPRPHKSGMMTLVSGFDSHPRQITDPHKITHNFQGRSV